MLHPKELIRSELYGWEKSEIIWFAFCCAVIMALSIYWGDTVWGTVSAMAGVACVVCTGKGKLSAYLFGLINCTLYAIISFNAGFYGETMLNGLYYFPMQFVGFYTWYKNMDKTTHEVKKRKMTWKGRVLLALSMLVGAALYGFVLRALGGNLPFVDAFTTASSVIALVVSIGMYVEQWYMWIVIDAVTVVMWAIAFSQGNDSVATLAMWVIYLINGFVMAIKWRNEANKNQ